MAARNSPASYKLQSLATMLFRYRVVSGGSWQSHQVIHRTPLPYGSACGGGSVDQLGLRFLSVTSRQYRMEKDESEEIKVQPALAAAPKFGFSNWVKWLLGSMMSLMLPLWNNKWDNLLKLEGEAAKVAEEVEVVAEVVEKVATTADKALGEVVKQLPDNSKLKEAAEVMEHVSTVAAHHAQLIENIIHKVGDVKHDIEDLNTMVEPIVDKIIEGTNTQNK